MITLAWKTQSWDTLLLTRPVNDPIILPNHRKSLCSIQGQIHSFSWNQSAAVYGMEGFSKTLENEGVSKLTAELTSDSCEWKSISNYQSAWIKSASYSVMMERWSVQNFWNWNYYFPFFLKNGMIKFRCFAIDCYFCLAYTKIDFMWCFV